ncbi:hypothetical protein RMATCC62417_09045 [Rhizopus microsporus]|nr:hypothetical protein RMATCC62417_09045 [Rhizopus microsporus]
MNKSVRYLDTDRSSSSSSISILYRDTMTVSGDEEGYCYYDIYPSSETSTFVSNDKVQYSSIDTKDDHQPCSFWGASLNLINAMMGTGILGLPLALHLCGIWLGLALSVGVAYMTCMIMHITILCGQRTHAFSLMELCRALTGKAGAIVVNCIIFLHTAGTAASYYIILGEMMPQLLKSMFPGIACYINKRNVVLVFGLCCTLPLSLTRSTACLAKWSAVSLFILLAMTLGVLIRVPAYYDSDNVDLRFTMPTDPFRGLAIMSLCFGCAPNLFGIYVTSKRALWSKTCYLAILIAYIINVSFGVLAYLCFGKLVQDNVLLNFPRDDFIIQWINITLSLFMVLTLPLCIHPCREATMMMFGISTHGATNKQHYLITFGVLAIILYAGCTLDSLGKVYDVLGGFSTIILGFLLPGLAYLTLFRFDESRMLYITSILAVIMSIPIIYFSLKNVF